jgi:protein ImuB
MALRGCISIDHLSLQILLQENPSWVGTPVAVTRDERPQSPILSLTREAREKGLAVGMKYANALSIVPSLRARAVSQDRLASARERIVTALSAFTPDIEPCPFDTDSLWVNVEGLLSLFESHARWSEQVRASLAAEGFRAHVVIGFTRFGTWAIVRSRARSMVFSTAEEEQALMARSSVDILPLPQRVKGTLRKLEIRTVRQFVSLPDGETTRRFGREAGLLSHAILSDDPLPIQPLLLKETMSCARHLDSPLSDLGLLMPHLEELLAVEVARAERDRSVISGLAVTLRTEDGDLTTDLVRPAVPTLDMLPLLRLVHLRMSARQFTSGVEDIEIRSARTQPSRAQEELFEVRGRDLKAGARAFAAIRARFGDESVAMAELADSWLPERSFKWVPVDTPALPRKRSTQGALAGGAAGAAGPAGAAGAGGAAGTSGAGGAAGSGRQAAVRRLLHRPAETRLDPRARRAAAGPFVLSGSWWGAGGKDAAFLRDYYFQESESSVLWTYVDRLTGQLWLQGIVD